MNKNQAIILGIDVGTSGMRACLVESSSNSILQFFSESMALPVKTKTNSTQSPQVWLTTLEKLLAQINHSPWVAHIQQIVVDATSSTVCLMNPQGQFLTPALMYDDKSARLPAQKIAKIAPEKSAAQGISSTLAKTMQLFEDLASTLPDNATKSLNIMHQIDVINYALTGIMGKTDINNALKLGYDVTQQTWPDWVKSLIPLKLPNVHQPGKMLGQFQPGLGIFKTQNLNHFPADISVHFGTTDSIAAFLATGAHKTRDCVTSLGSTLAFKCLLPQPIFSKKQGIYSHRLHDKWLVGGASNAGGAVLLHYFPLEQMHQLLPTINIHQPTGLNYYPLIQPGERFPIADPNLPPKLTPRPTSDAQFLQGILEGLVAIEKQGYACLFQSIDKIQAKEIRIFATGGGVKNSVWMALRQQSLPYSQSIAPQTEAAFGVTQILKSYQRWIQRE